MIEGDEAPPPQSPHEVDILHERQGLESAEPLIGRAGDQKPLIAIWQGKNTAAQCDKRGDAARRYAVIVEGKAEITRFFRILGPIHEATRSRRPAWRWPRIRVQEQKPHALRGFGAGAKLGPAAGRARNDAGAGALCDVERRVRRSPVTDDDLGRQACGARLCQRAERGRQGARRIQGWYDDAEHVYPSDFRVLLYMTDMQSEAAGLARALAAVSGFNDVRPQDLVKLPQKGLVHAHWRVGGRGFMLRVPRMQADASATLRALVRQAECFARAEPSGRTPRLRAAIPPSEDVPTGALVVEEITGHPPRLPAELSLLAEALAAIHALPVPDPDQRAPLDSPSDPFGATLAIVEKNLPFLDRVNLVPEARRQIDEEVAWARAFHADEVTRMEPPRQTLIVTDAHPGNFIVTSAGLAIFVDLERCAYGAPAIDVAHATLRPATIWDPECGLALGREDILRFVRAYFRATGPLVEDAIRPWLLPMRRLTWLRTTTTFARFRVERAAAGLVPDAAAHAEAVIADTLSPQTIAEIRREWLGPDPLAF